MKKAAKSITQSPVLGQVLLQLYLKVKESQNEVCKSQLREQETIGRLREKEIECALQSVTITKLESEQLSQPQKASVSTQASLQSRKEEKKDKGSHDLYYQDDEMPYEIYMDYLFKKKNVTATTKL